ncbi:MAG: hypothetical protein IKU48_04775 [Clostridia bacterium]|nr:hypothetical protein [Clostridia bacterium]
MNLCDLHTHILYGVDDGSDSLDYSLKMLRNAYASSVRTVVATPHYHILDNLEDNLNRNRVLKERFLQFKREASNISVDLLLGAEVRFSDNLIDMLRREAVPTINGSKYLLIEFLPEEGAQTISDALKSITECGIVPIVAHPERYISVCKNPMSVIEWLDMGCHLQLTGGSVIGEYGRSIRDTANILLKNDLVVCIASDAHGVNRRTNYLLDVFDYLSVYYSKAYARCLMHDNPMRICYDENL